MNKPYVICHMATTIDGRIITANWGKREQIKQFSSLYEECHNTFNSMDLIHRKTS